MTLLIISKPIIAIGEEGVVTTDEDGFAPLGAMSPGTNYYLVETRPKDDYNMLTKPVVITFEEAKITASCEQDNVIFERPEWVYQEDDGTWVVKINNSSGATLPSTGSSRTLLYTALGVTMLLSVGAVLTIRLKKQEEY